MKKRVNIVVPLAGAGTSFKQAGYTFPKPLIDINGKTMIQVVTENLKPKSAHKFIFVCFKEHYDKYSLHDIFHNSTKGNFEYIKLLYPTQGAACSVLTAIDFINNSNELIIANADQTIDISLDKFIRFARKLRIDGAIITFKSNHPRWSYVRIDKKGNVLETAEKKLISDNATAGIYYFREGSIFVKAATSMIEKDIRFNTEFYVCPVFNELILTNKKIKIFPIKEDQMHSLGTPEDLSKFLRRK